LNFNLAVFIGLQDEQSHSACAFMSCNKRIRREIMQRVWTSTLLFGAVVMLVGCGGGVDRPTRVAVTGKVEMGGKGVADAQVRFFTMAEKGAGGLDAYATTDAEGNFTLTTIETGDGAIPGDYTATVVKDPTALNAGAKNSDLTDHNVDNTEDLMTPEMMAAAETGTDGGEKAPAASGNQLPPQFASKMDSPFQFKVEAGKENNFTLKLD
jgi:hypothetical protein